jgi:hypothetical protein
MNARKMMLELSPFNRFLPDLRADSSAYPTQNGEGSENTSTKSRAGGRRILLAWLTMH